MLAHNGVYARQQFKTRWSRYLEQQVATTMTQAVDA